VFGSTSHIPSNPDLCTAVALLEQWMRDCEATHPKCRSVRTPSSLPTRVLYVGSGADLRLFKSNGQDAKYMTLSYCWGKSKLGIKTTKATLQHRICGIRWSRLPKTFQDAIEITRALGIEYLWIDSLCIIQDDQEDWQRESARMADIYAGSYLNIAATSAEDSQGGCFERRYRYQKDSGTKCPADPLKLELHLQGESASLFVRPDFENILHINPSDNTAGSPLLGRAWVYQERLLARRTIFFHHEEMVFECRSGTRCECGGIARLLRRGNKMRQFADLWLETVEKYSCLKLSYETDRLPALSGLASRLAQRFGTTYIAGLWKEDLPRALLWSRESYFGETIRSAAACTPTWSWASLYFLD
ncbi:heterokaryon incompatibility protein-domain-containing protein, partial [Bisporella sp. PMI_857]